MMSLRRIGVLLFLAVLVGFSATSVSAADGRQAQVPLRNRPFQFPNIHPDPNDACRSLTGGAFTLCDSFCNILHCTVRSSATCDVVRWKWMHLTFHSTFPCEAVAPPPTATATPEISATPTETGTPAGTASATATPEDTGTPTATETELTEPTATETIEVVPTATETEGPEPTATETEEVEPTATETEEVEPTETETEGVATATATITGTPTGTTAATFTPTTGPEATATSTTAPTFTMTPLPTLTNTTQPTATNTAQNTSTPTPTGTPTPTDTPEGPECPIPAGNYALTQVAGGFLTVDGLPAFPFPAGGTITQTVFEPDANCVSQTAVAFPGGFTAPTFCIPALGFSTSVVQTGCGVGRLDSDGGSDFTITEIGDTSAPNPPCSLPASCTAGANSNVRVDITVGNGAADTCSAGTANAAVSVPVFTTTWLTFSGCPDPDGVFNPPPGGTDSLIVSFPQTLDFTTDSTTASWSDIDVDGCSIAGAGPAAGFGTISGSCIDLTGLNVAGADVTTVASGTIGSKGSPLYDLTFVTVLPNEMSTTAGDAAICETPPLINFSGTATRCIGDSAGAAAEAPVTERNLRQRHNRGILGEATQAEERSRTRHLPHQ